MQWSHVNIHNQPGNLEQTTDWPEETDYSASLQEVTHAEEALPYNESLEDEKNYVPFTDGSCLLVRKHRKWKAAVWSPT